MKFTRQAAQHPQDRFVEHFKKRALIKLKLFRLRKIVRQSHEPVPKSTLDPAKQLELLCEHAGLSAAYQWVHLSELR
jgi:hypothetical protein